MKRLIVVLGALACLVLLSACGSAFLVGADMVGQEAPANALATYRLGACQSGGQPVAGGELTYYRAEHDGRPVLYEIGTGSKNARIFNTWTDETGEYFFTWVAGNAGYLYFFPTSPDQVPVRLIYQRGQWSKDTDTVEGVTMPVGTPSITCALTPA